MHCPAKMDFFPCFSSLCTVQQCEHVDSANRLVLVAKKYDHVVFASNLHIVNRD